MPQQSDDASLLIDDLVSLVITVLHDSQILELQAVDDLDLTFTQFKMLILLNKYPDGLTPSALADLVNLTVGATSRAVDSLVRSGFVSRTEDLSDRRSKKLTLTDKGKDTVHLFGNVRKTSLARLVDRLNGPQQEALHAAFLPLGLHPHKDCSIS